MRRTDGLLLLAGVLAANGCSPARPEYGPAFATAPSWYNSRPLYSFGVVPVHNAVRLFEAYQPLIDGINAQTSDFRVRLTTARDVASYTDLLTHRRLHFALLDPQDGLSAEENGYRPLAISENSVQGLVVVRRDSKIRSVADLRGATISFPAPTELAATMMTKLLLKSLGVDVNRESNPRYVGSQESSVMNVLHGMTAAGGVSAAAWSRLSAKPEIAKQLEVRWRTEPLSGVGLLARGDMPEAHMRKMTRILLSLSDTEAGKSILRGLQISDFHAAEAGSYDLAWEFMSAYKIAFGSLRRSLK